MEGFEERRRSGMGRFLGPEQLTRMDPLRLSQIFFGMPGVRLQSGKGGDVLLMAEGLLPEALQTFAGPRRLTTSATRSSPTISS